MRGAKLAPTKSWLVLMSVQTHAYTAHCSPARARALIHWRLQMFNYRRHLAVLPSTNGADVRRTSGLGPFIPKRYTRLLLVAVVWLAFVGSLSLRANTAEPMEPLSDPKNETLEDLDQLPDLPPTYQEYIDYERYLPQHNVSSPPPDGKHAKFLWIRNHARGALQTCFFLRPRFAHHHL
jgi:hypothetical protein